MKHCLRPLAREMAILTIGFTGSSPSRNEQSHIPDEQLHRRLLYDANEPSSTIATYRVEAERTKKPGGWNGPGSRASKSFRVVMLSS
jgi:hypothetical protein